VKVVSVEQMKAIEQRSADAGVPWPELMENAGLAVAMETRRYVEDVIGLSILVLVAILPIGERKFIFIFVPGGMMMIPTLY